MRLGTALFEGKGELVIAPKGETQFRRWSAIREKFASDKMVQRTLHTDHFIENSLFLKRLLDTKIEWHSCEGYSGNQLKWLKPFEPISFRDFYTFEEHVKNARASRGLEMAPEWYEQPVFYYSNHLSLRGPDAPLYIPAPTEKLDYELEIGAVLGKEILNATLSEAKEALFAYTLVNDWTARDTQAREMKLNMGPHKGKDFCTHFGPFLITPDEFESTKASKGYDQAFEANVNQERWSANNWKSIGFSFEEMLVRASQNCRLYPRELIASGTMGRGCLMEINALSNQNRWLKAGEEVELKWLPDVMSLKTRILDANKGS